MNLKDTSKIVKCLRRSKVVEEKFVEFHERIMELPLDRCFSEFQFFFMKNKYTMFHLDKYCPDEVKYKIRQAQLTTQINSENGLTQKIEANCDIETRKIFKKIGYKSELV